MKTKINKLLLLSLIISICSCQEEPKQNEKPIGERYKSNWDRDLDIEIVKVRDCEYVLWHNSYGSDMEHYEGCENQNHCK